jgi:hypothetical protein
LYDAQGAKGQDQAGIGIGRHVCYIAVFEHVIGFLIRLSYKQNNYTQKPRRAKMKALRAHLIEELNAYLEFDHDVIEKAFTQTIELSDLSPLAASRHAVRVDCVSYMTPLDLLGVMFGGWPIVAVYEAGIIQGFK